MAWSGAVMTAMLLAGQVPPPPGPPIPPPPPIVQVSPSAGPPAFMSPTRQLQRWLATDIRCGGQPVATTAVRRPYVSLPYAPQPLAPQHYRFRIDDSGRPLGIARQEKGYVWGTEDIAPSLAASRFPAGQAQRDCVATYTSDAQPLATAPIDDVISYSVTPTNGALPEEGWRRIRPVRGDCAKNPRAQWLTRINPDYRRLAGAPGARDWVLVGYDIDAKGRPISVRTVTGTQNAALDAAAVKAMAASRLSEGPRRGCLLPFSRYATRLPAPPPPEEASFRTASATCPADVRHERMPTLTYPAAWSRRSIEGWAMVTYDVAPWGEIGNVRAVAAEPAAEFGTAAEQVVRSARNAATGTGYTGCVDRVRFAMPEGTNEVTPPSAG